MEGKMNQFDMELENGEAIRLKGIRCEKSYRAKEEELLLEVGLRAEASFLNGSIQNATEQQKMEEAVREKLTEELQYEADRMLLEMQVDITNGFYSLGGYNRELYPKYGTDMMAYKKDLRIKVATEITLVIE